MLDSFVQMWINNAIKHWFSNGFASGTRFYIGHQVVIQHNSKIIYHTKFYFISFMLLAASNSAQMTHTGLGTNLAMSEPGFNGCVFSHFA